MITVESSNPSIVPTNHVIVSLSDPTGSVYVEAPPGFKPGYSDIRVTFYSPDGVSCPTVREFRVYFGNLWLGHTTDWGVPFNWSRQVVPGISPPFDEAYIPTIPEGGHFPLVPQNYEVNYVEMETETSISVAQNRTLSILEDLNFQGNAIISGDGAIVAKNVNIPSGLINITTPTALLKVESNLDLGSASSEGIIRTPGFIQIGESGKDAFITHNAGRIIGEIRHWINAGIVANRDIHLPLGTEDDNRWVVMKFVSPPSSNGFIQIWVQMDNPFSADPDLGIPCEAIGEKVSVLLGGSFWRITPLNNAFSEGGYSYDVQFYTEGMNGLASYLPTELKMIKRTINPDSGWFLPGYPKEPISVDPLNNTYWLIRSEVETFSFFTVGKDDIPLPIELLSFSATYRDPDVLLEWATGSEIYNDYFTIERSPDVEQAEIIGYVDGAGNSSQTLWYGFVDQNPLPGISYYRLKQTDFDGKFEYFDWVAVDAGLAGGDGLKVVVETHLQGHTLRIFSPGRKRLQVEVTDLLGQKVISQELNPSDIGQVDVFIPETLSRQGVLIYRVTDGIEVVSGKIVR